MTHNQRELALAAALYDMVCQDCRGNWPCAEADSDHFGSGCLSTYADALLCLAECGILVIVGEVVGRAVEARDTDPPWNQEAMPPLDPPASPEAAG